VQCVLGGPYLATLNGAASIRDAHDHFRRNDMQQHTQRTTAKVATGSKSVANAQVVAAAREREAADTTGRSRYCEPGLERLLRQAPEGISLSKSR
jgi:hypothetical protein